MNKVFRYLISVSLLLVLLSCTKDPENPNNDNGGNNDNGNTGGSKLELFNSQDLENSPAVSFLGGTFELKFLAGEDWTATVSYIDGEDWVTIDPENGPAGENILKITTTQNNIDESRIAKVNIKSGKLMRTLQIEQEAYEMRLDYPRNFISPLGRDIFISISSGYEYEISESECDWIEFKEEIKDEKSTTLRYTVAPNSGENREARFVLGLKGVEKQEDIIIKQEGIHSGNESWINRDFYKQTLAVKFTNSTCGGCPIFSTFIEQARGILPERILTYSVCTFDQEKSIAYSDGDLQSYYNVTSTPQIILDGKVRISVNKDSPYSVPNQIVEMAEESCTYNEHIYYSAAVSARAEGSKVKVDVKAYAKESGQLRMVVALVEDNIIASQKDYNHPDQMISDYKHNHILRKFFTKSQGNVFTFETSGSQDFTFEMETSGGLVSDIQNCKVIVYFFRDIISNYTSMSAKNISLLRYPEYIDNAVEVKVGETTALRFE